MPCWPTSRSSPLQPRPIKGMRLAVPTTIALDDLDDAVAQDLRARAEDAVASTARSIERIEVPEFLDIGPMNAKGGFAAAESYAWHRYLIASKGDVYDPRVSVRILRGEAHERGRLYRSAQRAPLADRARRNARSRPMTRWCCRPPPTRRRASPISPTTRRSPRQNLRALRNCTLINMIDGCAISLPAHREGEVPVGLMLAARADRPPYLRTGCRHGGRDPCLT